LLLNAVTKLSLILLVKCQILSSSSLIFFLSSRQPLAFHLSVLRRHHSVCPCTILSNCRQPLSVSFNDTLYRLLSLLHRSLPLPPCTCRLRSKLAKLWTIKRKVLLTKNYKIKPTYYYRNHFMRKIEFKIWAFNFTSSVPYYKTL
jgi:hypothetical protein